MLLEPVQFAPMPYISPEEWQTALESIDQAAVLRQYQERLIRNNGISIPDTVSIETVAPGLLSKAPHAFTYRPSPTNLEYSQEAIGEKIDALIARSKVILDKLIAWIQDTCKKIKTTFTVERIRMVINKLHAATKGNEEYLTVPQVIAMLDGDTYAYDNHPLVKKLGHVVKSELSLTNFQRVKSGDADSWVAALGDLGITVPTTMIPEETKAILDNGVWHNLRSLLIQLDQDTDVAEKLSQNPAYKKLHELAKTRHRVNRGIMLNTYKQMTDGTYLVDLNKSLDNVDGTVTMFSKKLDSQWKNRDTSIDTTALKQNRAAAHDALRMIADIVENIRDALSGGIGLIQWSAYSRDFVIKENVIRVRDAGDLTAD